mgnify:CR=1 FL=1
MSNYLNISNKLKNHFKIFMNEKINKDCFFEKFSGGTRRTPILEKILLSSNIETIISGKSQDKGNCNEFDYQTFFDLIRLAWQEWLKEHIKNIDINDIKDEEIVTKNIVYMLKLIDEPLNVDIAVISQERSDDASKVTGKLYELLIRGEYKSIIPINKNGKEFNKEIKKFIKTVYVDNNNNNNNNNDKHVLQLFKMVSIKSTSITSASQVGDHQFIIATFYTNDEKKYYFGIGGGYDYTKKNFFMYETDLHGLSKFNINSKKNHYIHCNGIKTLTDENINTFFNDWKAFIEGGEYTTDRTFGNGILYKDIDYDTYVSKLTNSCKKHESKNCASFVDMVWNFAKGNVISPKNNLSINILPRIISTFYHTPNTGLYVPGGDVQNSMLNDKNPKYKIYKFTNKIIHKLLELKTKAYKLDVPLFKDDLIEWMKDTAKEVKDTAKEVKDTAKEMNNNNKQDDESKGEEDDVVMPNDETDIKYENMKKKVQDELEKEKQKQKRIENNVEKLKTILEKQRNNNNNDDDNNNNIDSNNNNNNNNDKLKIVSFKDIGTKNFFTNNNNNNNNNNNDSKWGFKRKNTNSKKDNKRLIDVVTVEDVEVPPPPPKRTKSTITKSIITKKNTNSKSRRSPSLKRSLNKNEIYTNDDSKSKKNKKDGDKDKQGGGSKTRKKKRGKRKTRRNNIKNK